MPDTATEFSRSFVSYVEIDTFSEYDKVIKNLLSGAACLFVEGYDACIIIDSRTYPARNVGEPEQDKSLRGSRDGFVETIVFNTALIRRRIRDPHLTMKMMEIGKSSRTDVVLCYMSDRVNTDLLALLTRKIEEMQDEDLKMNQQSLAETFYLSGNGTILSPNSNTRSARTQPQPVCWKENRADGRHLTFSHDSSHLHL